MLLVTGTALDMIERERKSETNTWIERTLKVFGGHDVHYVVLKGNKWDEQGIPSHGDRVVIECSVSAFARKNGRGGYDLVGWRLTEADTAVREAEAVVGSTI